MLEKTFEKLLKNETNTLPKSLVVSSVKKKLLKEKILSMVVEETWPKWNQFCSNLSSNPNQKKSEVCDRDLKSTLVRFTFGFVFEK